MGSTNPNVPLLLDLVSIGQSMNYQPRRKCLIRPIPLFALLRDLVSIGQSAICHPRIARLIVSPALFFALLDIARPGSTETYEQYLFCGR